MLILNNDSIYLIQHVCRPSLFACHKDLEEGCCRVVLKPGDIFAMPSEFIHFVLTRGDSIAFGTNFLSKGHMSTIIGKLQEETSYSKDERFPGITEMVAILLKKAIEACRVSEVCTDEFCTLTNSARLHNAINKYYSESAAQEVSLWVPSYITSIIIYIITSSIISPPRICPGHGHSKFLLSGLPKFLDRTAG